MCCFLGFFYFGLNYPLVSLWESPATIRMDPKLWLLIQKPLNRMFL